MGCRKQKVAGRKRQEKMNSVQGEFSQPCEISQVAKIRKHGNFNTAPKLLPSSIPAKQRTPKNKNT